MSLVDDVLARYGLTLGDLNAEAGETDTFFKMLEAAEGKHITLDALKIFIRDLIYQNEQALATTPELEYYLFGLLRRPNRAHVQLKARLLNYLLIEGFVTSPERARRMLEATVARLAKDKSV